MSTLLSLLLSLTNVSILWQSPECQNPDLMGYYVAGKRTITVCKENAQKRRTPVDLIVKHEYVHFVYDVKGPEFFPIPEPALTHLVTEMMEPGEILFVIIQESDYSRDEEFTARILAELPDPLFVVWAVRALYA